VNVKKRKKKAKVRWFSLESDILWEAARQFGHFEIAIRWTGEGNDHKYAIWDRRTGKRIKDGQLRFPWDPNQSTRQNQERMLSEIHESFVLP
jgi:hypothetical protein